MIDQSPSQILNESGAFARAVEGFNPRDAQMEMADAVAQALEEKSVLVAEAGTGTGKTYAYLVPALLSEERIIISTGTKNLQDQLYHRDLPQVRKILGVSSVTALLKGRANYLCLYRLKLAEEEGQFRSRKQAAQFVQIRKWAAQTKRGDIAEHADMQEDDPLWYQVTSTADNCLGQECEDWKECYVVKARRKAQEADIVVVNHHLFFADMALKEEGFGDLLPGANGVIFDEAHQLSEVATRFFGEMVSDRQFRELADDTIAVQLQEAPDLKILREQADKIKIAAADVRLKMGEQLGSYPWSAVRDKNGFRDQIDELQTLMETFNELLSDAAERGKGLTSCAERCEELLERFIRLTDQSTAEQIHWVEIRKRGFAIHHTPMEIRDTFQEFMNKRKCAWVFTSATLAVDGKFDHFLNDFGIEKARTEQWESPFDYQKQALFFHPKGLPFPNQPNYDREMVEMMRPVIEAGAGRTFFLFTSHRALRAAAEQLREADFEFPLLVQGEAAKSELLAQFRESGNAVLLGASSFWEGVDVRGEALSCVIIDRFPFASPGDPVLQAKIQAFRNAGRNPFMELQLPRAVIALRQGAGRLIRDETDRGVFVICDTRLLKKQYGHTFLNSLPNMARTRDVEEVKVFFGDG